MYFKKYQNNTSCWERGIIKKRIVLCRRTQIHTYETPEPVTEMPFERLQRRTTSGRRANRHHFRHVRFRSSPINISVFAFSLVTLSGATTVTLTLTLWPINAGVLTSLILSHLPSSLFSLNLLCHSKTDARFM